MKIWKTFLGFLVLVTTAIWLAVLTFPDKNLHLIACDVGQGDAILITQGSNQVLIDGGPDKKVLDCLGKYLPFWDREIELVVLSHPHEDHYRGLMDVIKKYNVASWLEGGVPSGSQEHQVLEDLVGGSKTSVLKRTETTNLRVGLIYLDILNQVEDDKLNKKEEKGNEESLVLSLRSQNFEAIFTGDTPKEELLDLIEKNQIKTVNYIKISHHGSKSGTSKEVLDLLEPKIAVISVGKNFYGHPNQEVLELLKERKIKVLRTDEEGDIQIISDGEKVWEQ